ncbi:MAG: DEAD/DEAH box helicase [Betaproteobacteria bacterium]|nr:DEAD/DEAH box helicase [Betaproteobacteria bacterium]
MSFETLGLMPELLRAIADQGYTEATPIQLKAIPPVLAHHDIMGCAQTGTGKTAGFALPILQMLAPQQSASPSPARHPIRALILTPTRELAAQVEESVRAYGKYLALRSTVVFGGVDIDPQIKVLRGGVEILVATPGRLLDHVQQKTVNLSRVEILVLDEADRMLDMGFMPDIKRILALLPRERQNLMFSATFSDEIKRLAGQILRSPVMVEVARRNAPTELVTHQMYEVEAGRKRALLTHLIKSRDMRQVLVFVRMKRDANRLTRELVRDGVAATAIHSDRTQGERMQALEDFKQGTVNVLVATDIAARGLDIELLPYVINYELPHVAEDYIHRIGRTGRAGSTGEAISLVCADEHRMLDDVERALKAKLERLPLPQLAGSRQSGSAAGGHHLAAGNQAAPPGDTTPRRAMRPPTSRRPVTSRPIPSHIPSRRRRRYPEVSISASHTRPSRRTTPLPLPPVMSATPAPIPGQPGGQLPHCWADSPPKKRSD